MNLTSARLMIDAPLLTISDCGTNDDGGLVVLGYRAVPIQREYRSCPAGPPRIPREVEYSPWLTFALVIASALLWLLAGYGAVGLVRWLFE